MIFGSSDWTAGQNAESRRQASGSRPMKRVLTPRSPSSEIAMMLSLQPGRAASPPVGDLVLSASLGAVHQYPVNAGGWVEALTGERHGLNDVIASQPFGLVERLVGATQQQRSRLTLRKLGHAEARGDRSRQWIHKAGR